MSVHFHIFFLKMELESLGCGLSLSAAYTQIFTVPVRIAPIYMGEGGVVKYRTSQFKCNSIFLWKKFVVRQSVSDDNESYPPTEQPLSADKAASVEAYGKTTTIAGNDSNSLFFDSLLKFIRLSGFA